MTIINIRNKETARRINKAMKQIAEGENWSAVTATRSALEQFLKDWMLKTYGVAQVGNGSLLNYADDFRVRKALGGDLAARTICDRKLGNKGAHTITASNEEANQFLNTALEVVARLEGTRLKRVNIKRNPLADRIKEEMTVKVKNLEDEIATVKTAKEAELAEAKAREAAAKKEAETAEAMRLIAEANVNKPIIKKIGGMTLMMKGV